jgi:hypothetical protein
MRHPNYRSLITKTKLSTLSLFVLFWLPVTQVGAQETSFAETSLPGPSSQNRATTQTDVKSSSKSELAVVKPAVPSKEYADERYDTFGRAIKTAPGQLPISFDGSIRSPADLAYERQTTNGSSGMDESSSNLSFDRSRVQLPSWDYGLNDSRIDSSVDSGQPTDSESTGDAPWTDKPADPGYPHETVADEWPNYKNYSTGAQCPQCDPNTSGERDIGHEDAGLLAERQSVDMIRPRSGRHGAAFYQTHGLEQEMKLRQPLMDRRSNHLLMADEDKTSTPIATSILEGVQEFCQDLYDALFPDKKCYVDLYDYDRKERELEKKELAEEEKKKKELEEGNTKLHNKLVRPD